MDLVLQGGTVVTGKQRYEADVGVEDGLVAMIGRPRSLKGEQTLDVRGLYVLPGLIDAHVHFRDRDFSYKEDFESGSRAAAAGGITLVIDMPSTPPRVVNKEVLDDKITHIQGRSYVEFGLYALLIPDNIAKIPELAASGVAGFKGFMALSASQTPVLDDFSILEGLTRVTKCGSLLAVHAENQGILDGVRVRLTAEGCKEHSIYPQARPAIAEEEAVRRLVFFADSIRGRLHIVHLSTAGGLEAVREGKRRGVSVTAETTPFHLLLSTKDAEAAGPLAVTNPPLRSPGHGEALWTGLLDRSIDIIATDHSPHAPEEKLRENVWEVSSGTVAVQSNIPLMLSQVANQRLRLEDIVRMCSERVAEIFGFSPRKGRIAVGSDADLTVVDMNRRGEIRGENFLTKTKLTPFEGWKLQGMPVYTIVRGQVVMADGRIVGKPQGKFISAKPRFLHS
ncbi:MAG: allantoinase AllB [Candidatus Binatia bacterium]